ncbi:MAG TPA: 16S rRNA (guanine(966)-N(2))-methyltransferase RsmD [Steroidobacteraceae bacterium]|nr:16S rRNA (guanine(966)-N(2))-methyltransferase RsmD [Steroidobacteraceae bacterium]
MTVKKSGKSRATPRGHDANRGARESGAQSRVLRIIGGRHRGRRLRFPAGVAIRPTPDRVRETLFNWLQSRIVGAHVLDLFAGSGALGLEALSRGAAHVTFIEKDRRAAAAIDELAREWLETQVWVQSVDALSWLESIPPPAAFDIVFVDPPYDANLLEPALQTLARRKLLKPDARVYLEQRAREALPALPQGWNSIRDGRAGEVGYHLLTT